MVIYGGKLFFLTTPPLCSPKYSPRFLHIWLFFDGGEREPNDYSNIPPLQLYSKGESSLINNNEQVLHSYILSSKQQD